MNGWIKLHRKMQQWIWWHDARTVQLFLYLLLNANAKEQEHKGTVVRRGERATGQDRTIPFGFDRRNRDNRNQQIYHYYHQ